MRGERLMYTVYIVLSCVMHGISASSGRHEAQPEEEHCAARDEQFYFCLDLAISTLVTQR